MAKTLLTAWTLFCGYFALMNGLGMGPGFMIGHALLAAGAWFAIWFVLATPIYMIGQLSRRQHKPMPH